MADIWVTVDWIGVCSTQLSVHSLVMQCVLSVVWLNAYWFSDCIDHDCECELMHMSIWDIGVLIIVSCNRSFNGLTYRLL